MDALLDSVYQRLRGTGPEFEGWLSNHGPMAADALIRLGRSDAVGAWTDGYMWRLEDSPRPRWRVEESEWREVLGDSSRLGDWLAFFSERVRNEPWTELLARWWPRLVPGAVASATHGLIRTGHAVRAVADDPNPQRLAELAQGLGYWAARWRHAPQVVIPGGTTAIADALRGLPRIDDPAGFVASALDIAEHPDWGPAVEQLRPINDESHVPAALDHLVDAAVDHYRSWATDEPVMLVHAATAPRAASLVIPHLPPNMWIPTYNHAWIASATIISAYRSSTAQPVLDGDQPETPDRDRMLDRIVATGDEHAIKFAEVAVESFERGSPHALASADRAATLIGN